MSSIAEQRSERVLIVDDEDAVVRLLRRMLMASGYDSIAVNSCAEALSQLEREPYPLVISDINMPKMTGVELLERITAQSNVVAVIMLTAVEDVDTAVHCLKAGAYDYLTKPVNEIELSLSVSRALERRDFIQNEREYQQRLEREVAAKTVELRQTVEELLQTQTLLKSTQREVIYRLAITAEYRDEDTWDHIVRVSETSRLLAAAVKQSEDFCDMIRIASPLHDIGKIGIPDNILLKPGRLEDHEFEQMKTHTEIGARILENSRTPLMHLAREIVLTHHERFDGSGYPHGLKGEDIPFSGRITSIVDVFDALTSERPYKKAWEVDRALATILEGSGTQFDPQLTDVFSSCLEDIVAVRDHGAKIFQSDGDWKF